MPRKPIPHIAGIDLDQFESDGPLNRQRVQPLEMDTPDLCEAMAHAPMIRALHSTCDEARWERIMSAAADRAERGDIKAAQWLSDRLLGKVRNGLDPRRVTVPGLPVLDSLDACVRGAVIVAQLLGEGQISIETADAANGAVTLAQEALNARDLERQVMNMQRLLASFGARDISVDTSDFLIE